MAISGPIPVSFDQAFPHGAYVTTEVEPVAEFKDGKPGAQVVDEDSGLLVWSVTVMDADPLVRGAAKSVKVKLLAKHQPTPPEVMPGTPFRPVEFEQMSATPYVVEVMRGRHKVAYSLRARGMTAPKTLAQMKEAAPITAGKAKVAA